MTVDNRLLAENLSPLYTPLTPIRPASDSVNPQNRILHVICKRKLQVSPTWTPAARRHQSYRGLSKKDPRPFARGATVDQLHCKDAVNLRAFASSS